MCGLKVGVQLNTWVRDEQKPEEEQEKPHDSKVIPFLS